MASSGDFDAVFDGETELAELTEPASVLAAARNGRANMLQTHRRSQ